MRSANGVDFSRQNRGAQMTARFRKGRCLRPTRSSINGKNPMIGGISLAIGFVAAEIVERSSQTHQSTRTARLRQRRAGAPEIGNDVVFPHGIRGRTGIDAGESAGQPDGVSIDGWREMS